MLGRFQRKYVYIPGSRPHDPRSLDKTKLHYLQWESEKHCAARIAGERYTLRNIGRPPLVASCQVLRFDRACSCVGERQAVSDGARLANP
jgi:hypothetical protein